jgi:dimethylamine/trimethylamine dehydrogenase
VLARQGVEHVHLVEADRQVGGHFRWVPRLPGLAQWIRLIDYRKAIAEKHRNLAVITNKRLSLDEVLDYGADRVIVATGSRWAGDGCNAFSQGAITGADAMLDHILTPEQIMVDQKAPPGAGVLVYDCEGYFTGPSLAEKLALDGRAVTLITPLTTIAPYMRHTEEIHRMLPRLHELGVELVTDYQLDVITPDGARGHNREYASHEMEWRADAVALVTQRVPDDVLYKTLIADQARLDAAGIQAVYRIGDCIAARPQVADAVFDGHRLAREIDCDDPMMPLPWIREARFLGTSDSELDSTVAGDVPVTPRSSVPALVS